MIYICYDTKQYKYLPTNILQTGHVIIGALYRALCGLVSMVQNSQYVT